ncbi:hypothetical protein BDZ91DRAFT_709086, partial [Kalaharituber pfeilii]
MSEIPDSVIELARLTFPDMTDIEIMEKLLEGDESDMEKMVDFAVDAQGEGGGGGGAGGAGGRQVKKLEDPPSWPERIKRPQFRNSAVNMFEGGKLQQPAHVIGESSEPPKGAEQAPKHPHNYDEPLTPEEQKELAELLATLGFPAFSSPQGDLSYELALLSLEEKMELVKLLTEHFRPPPELLLPPRPAPDATTSHLLDPNLPVDFNEVNPLGIPKQPGEVHVPPFQSSSQLEPEPQSRAAQRPQEQAQAGQQRTQEQQQHIGLVLDPTKLTPEQIQSILAIANGPGVAASASQLPPFTSVLHLPPDAPPYPTLPPDSHAPLRPPLNYPPPPSAPKIPTPKPSSSSTTTTLRPKPPIPTNTNLRALIPPRPASHIPIYPDNQLSTPHNPVYTYDVSLLNHADPYHTLDRTDPRSNKSKTSHLPPLPDAHTRYHLNNPICIPQSSSASPSGPPKFIDCSRAISNIVSSSPLALETCREARGWSVTKHIVSEFGTCRVVATNQNGKAGCAELDKVKHLAGRVLRECSEGGIKDRRLRTVEGKVGYLFVREEAGEWDVMEVGLERAIF